VEQFFQYINCKNAAIFDTGDSHLMSKCIGCQNSKPIASQNLQFLISNNKYFLNLGFLQAIGFDLTGFGAKCLYPIAFNPKGLDLIVFVYTFNSVC